MLFKKIIFENYKTYYGIQEVDLYIPKEVREEGKNIILLGGLNGAGKTTILKSILYVLFGERGMNEREYKQLQSNIINNTFFDEGGRESAVTLILERDDGEEWQLKVKWYFDSRKRVSHEERDLFVRKPGSSVNKRARILNLESYNKFIDKVIPYHAAPFFIFDGEEIKDIILRQNSKDMRDAIHKITGMEAYTQLLSDLKSLKSSYERKLSNSVSHTKLNKYNEELKEIDSTLERMESKRNKVLSKYKEFEEILNNVKKERNEKVLQNSKSRETIVKRQSKLEMELNMAKEEFSTYYKENVLNIILGNKINKLKKQIKLENEMNNKRILQENSLTPYRDFMSQLLSEEIDPPLTNSQLDQIKKIGEEIWIRENNVDSTPDNTEEIHDLSNKDYAYLTNLAIKDKVHLTNLLNKIEKIEEQLRNLEIEIRDAPETVDIEEENKKIDSLTQQIGEFKLRLKTINKRIKNEESKKSNIMNKLTRLSGKDVNLEDLQKQYELTQKTITTMGQYLTDVTNMKAQYIKEEFSKMLKQLFRKQDEFGKIEFDIDTYTIRLYNDRMQEISIQERSAGEMQMISSALIWALTKASDLSLPMVVDTPLGRLDSYHRNHLINHYYKELSDQVIILSTDTEITEEYVKLMEEHSYKQYMLDYNEEKKYTVIRDGYFEFVKD
ncbi:DNA sulfur modification protein DndD [Salinibacillus aidingensis]|uniref:Nuclease SbcCD subunit C n=1 Tax=Salinibacillus aidingensis TaxID=237684 RepID=A0ABN1BSF5_9BACI